MACVTYFQFMFSTVFTYTVEHKNYAMFRKTIEHLHNVVNASRELNLRHQRVNNRANNVL